MNEMYPRYSPYSRRNDATRKASPAITIVAHFFQKDPPADCSTGDGSAVGPGSPVNAISQPPDAPLGHSRPLHCHDGCSLSWARTRWPLLTGSKSGDRSRTLQCLAAIEYRRLIARVSTRPRQTRP